VLKRCVYGVDKNPMAVELAKVALWLHTFTVGAPLSFLDHHLRCGDSVNVGSKPGQWGGVIAGHLDERGTTQEWARSGPFLCRRACAADQGLVISPVSGSTVSVLAWFCSAPAAAARGRLEDCFRR